MNPRLVLLASAMLAGCSVPALRPANRYPAERLDIAKLGATLVMCHDCERRATPKTGVQFDAEFAKATIIASAIAHAKPTAAPPVLERRRAQGTPSAEPFDHPARELSRQQLAELKALVGDPADPQAHRPAEPSSDRIATRIRRMEGRVANANVAILRAPFAGGSTTFRPSDTLAQALLAAAPHANTIRITGFTASRRKTAGTSALALGRARAARAYLIQHGVAANTIQTTYQSSGGFIAPNETRSELNRRVEFEVVFPEVIIH